MKQTELTKLYNVSDGTITSIVNNKCYIDKDYKRTKWLAKEGNKLYKLTIEIANKIRDEYKKNPKSYASIGWQYGCSGVNISNIINNKIYIYN